MKTKKNYFVSVKKIKKDSSKLLSILSFSSFSFANEAFKDELVRRSSLTGFIGFNYIFYCPVNVSRVACCYDGFIYEVSLITIEDKI